MSIEHDPPSIEELVPINEVERQTGIRQSTLRMWEKRYGFPQPLRDRHGDRIYPSSQVERLHAVRRLIDQGVRPGKIFSGTAARELSVHEALSKARPAVSDECQHVLRLLRAYRLSELHTLFQQRLLDLGLRRFVIDFLAPQCAEVGLAWSRGDLPVRCEHLFSQLAIAALHAKQEGVRSAGDGGPKVVLAALTGESHVLGILMAEAVMASLGMHCIQLGAETPPQEVAAAARECGADIVALSFSGYFPRKSMVRMTTAVRAALPPATALWVGGDAAHGAGVLVPGIEVFSTLDAIEPALRCWQARQSGLTALRQ